MILNNNATWLIENHDAVIEELIRMREERRAAKESKENKK